MQLSMENMLKQVVMRQIMHISQVPAEPGLPGLCQHVTHCMRCFSISYRNVEYDYAELQARTRACLICTYLVL
jgi:hypothetical protein